MSLWTMHPSGWVWRNLSATEQSLNISTRFPHGREVSPPACKKTKSVLRHAFAWQSELYIYMLSIEMVYLMSVPSCQWSRARRPETYPRSHRSNRGGRRDCDVELWRGLRLPEWRSCWWRWCRCAWSPRAARWEAHLGRLGLHCLRPRIRHCYSRLPSQSLLWRIGRGQTMR